MRSALARGRGGTARWSPPCATATGCSCGTARAPRPGRPGRRPPAGRRARGQARRRAPSTAPARLVGRARQPGARAWTRWPVGCDPGRRRAWRVGCGWPGAAGPLRRQPHGARSPPTRAQHPGADAQPDSATVPDSGPPRAPSAARRRRPGLRPAPSAARWRSRSTVALDGRDDLSLAYTPGVGAGVRGDRAPTRRWPTTTPGCPTPSPSSPTAPRCSGSATSAPRRRCRSWRARRCCSSSSAASTPCRSAWTPRTPTRSSRPSSGSRRASAASTSRTSPRRAASRSSSGSRSCSTSPSSTTTSTAPPWSRSPRCENAAAAHRPQPGDDRAS